jgi:hypothetical protein
LRTTCDPTCHVVCDIPAALPVSTSLKHEVDVMRWGLKPSLLIRADRVSLPSTRHNAAFQSND